MNRQDEFYVFAVQGTQIDVDRIELTFVDLAPLTERSHRAVPDLILEPEDHVAVVGLIQTTDLCLEPVTGLDPEGWIFATDPAIIYSFWMGQETVSLRFAVLHLR